MKNILILVLSILLNLFSSAQITFERSYNCYNSDESARSIFPTFDGGFILAGRSTSFPGSQTLPLLIKLDQVGDLHWCKGLWGQPSWYGTFGNFRTVIQLPDSGFLIGGFAEARGCFIVRTNSVGDTIWNKSFSDSLMTTSACNSIIQTFDGNFITCFKNLSDTTHEIIKFLKFDINGNIIWLKDFNFQYEYSDLNAIYETSDHGFAFFATRNRPSISLNMFMAKFDMNGDSSWTRNYGSIYSFCYDGQQTSDGGFILCGSDNNQSVQNVFLVKTDSIGDTLWTKKFGGTGIEQAIGFSVKETSDNGYIISGMIANIGAQQLEQGDLYLIRTDSLGNELWSRDMNTYNFQSGACVESTSDGGFVICGASNSYHGPYEVYVVKVNDAGNIILNNFSFDNDDGNISVFPNPTTGMVTISYPSRLAEIKIALMNSFGQVIEEKNYTYNSKIEFEIRHPIGLYFIRINSEGRSKIFKVVKY